MRTGRKRRSISWQRGGPPHNITLGRLIVVPGQDRVRHLLTPSLRRSHVRSAARFACECETHLPGKARRYWLPGWCLRFSTVRFLGAVPRRSCSFGRRIRAAVCGFGYHPCFLARSGGDSNAVASAGAPTRLSARAGRTSLHHRFAFSGAVSARRAVARAWAVAQPGAQADLPPASQLSAVSFRNHCRTGAHRVAAGRLALR